MKKLLPLSGFLLLFSFSALACLNELRPSPTHWKEVQVAFGPSLKKDSIPQPELFNRKNELEKLYAETPSFELANDLAVVLIRLSDAQTAKEILLSVEADTPGIYSIASNLGTAYEILGKNDSALLWIQKAVNINPAAHEGSEWMHVMILRHKLAREKDPGYMSGNSALMLDFGTRDLPENPYSMDLNKIKVQLAYQLEERLGLIEGPDTLTAMLLFDYANLAALTDQLRDAVWYYEAARSSGFDSELLDARLERLKELLEDKEITSLKGQEPAELTPVKVNVYLIATLLALLAVWGVWLLLRRGKNNR